MKAIIKGTIATLIGGTIATLIGGILVLFFQDFFFVSKPLKNIESPQKTKVNIPLNIIDEPKDTNPSQETKKNIDPKSEQKPAVKSKLPYISPKENTTEYSDDKKDISLTVSDPKSYPDIHTPEKESEGETGMFGVAEKKVERFSFSLDEHINGEPLTKVPHSGQKEIKNQSDIPASEYSEAFSQNKQLYFEMDKMKDTNIPDHWKDRVKHE